MPEFVNTIDRVGDDVLTDSIILRNITEFNDNVITVVGDSAFYKCTALTSVDLPSVVSVGSDAFFGCSALVEAYLPVATKLSRSFDGCSALTNVYIPSVTSIGGQCFRGCTSLTCVDLPAVNSFSDNVFYGATGLTALVIRRTVNVASLLISDALLNTPIASGTGYIYVPGTLLNTYKTATNWSIYADQFRKLEDWTVDGTVTGELDIDNRHMVRFFNDDGTLLGYKVVAKGSDAVYDGATPVKPDVDNPEEYEFGGWNPSNENITADTDCYVKWKTNEITEDWATVSANADSYKIGQKKAVVFTYADGTSETIYFTIIDKKVDTTRDNQTAILTFMADNAVKSPAQIATSYASAKSSFYDSTAMSEYMNTLLQAMPSELQDVILELHKYNDGFFSSFTKVFIPSLYQLTGQMPYSGLDGNVPSTHQYSYFVNGNSKYRSLVDGNRVTYWLCTQSANPSSTNKTRKFYTYGTNVSSANFDASYYIVPCFCIGLSASA